MSLRLDDVVRRVRAQASRSINGEALVVLTERRQLHRLNAVGTRVWELCDECSVADIVRVIVTEFEVDDAAATRDVCEFLENMQELGAIEVRPASGHAASEDGA